MFNLAKFRYKNSFVNKYMNISLMLNDKDNNINNNNKSIIEHE